MPSRTTISRCLDFVYFNLKVEVIKSVQDHCPNHAAMTFDQWTDRYRRLPYNTSTLHYWDENFEAVNLTLKTSLFSKNHTGQNINAELDTILEEYELLNKTIHMVTDAARNVRKACELGEYENLLCLGHGLHNLMYTDGIMKTEDVSEIMKKTRNIVKALRYKAADFHKISEDTQSRFDDWDDDDDDGEDNETDDEGDGQATNPLPKLKSLKLDVVTRWYSQLFMLESLVSRTRKAINDALKKYDHEDLCLSRKDFELIEKLIEFMIPFRKITTISSGEKYSTINMACLFRSEIIALLEESDKDIYEIAELKENMRAKLDHRFPMSELIVVAALLDPKSQNLLDVKNFLKDNGTTAFDLLKEWVIKYDAPAACEKEPVQKENLNYIEELIQKHSSLSAVRQQLSKDKDIDKEIYLLLSLSDIEEKNVRLFWKKHSKQMPKLSYLARSILCIPITSTPSERIFSIAGIIVNSRRSSLLPSNLDRILFIHNNYQFCKRLVLENFELLEGEE